MTKRITQMFFAGLVLLVMAACTVPDTPDVLGPDLDEIEESPCVCEDMNFQEPKIKWVG